MKDLQATLKRAAQGLENLGFTHCAFFVDVEDKERCKAQISFKGEEGKARTFGGYLDSVKLHHGDSELGFSIEGEDYKITLQPAIHMIKHEHERKFALMHELSQLIKDIETYRMRL